MSLQSPPNPCTMKTPLILLISLTTLYTATVVEGMKTHHLYAAIGSSVFFPGENLDKYTFYDFRKAESPFIVTCHDGCSVQGLYDKRGQFFQSNGTFRLNDLRVEDSGIYEYEMNFTVKGRSHLQVIAPVVVPVLLKPELRDDHMFVFTCQAQGDGPFNFTLLRNNERLRNAVTNDISSSWYMNGLDPATYGSFSCDVANPVSSKTSPSIELPPPAPVMEPVLLKQEVIENGSQCLVTFTSRVEGDGPFNFTLLRNDNEIIQNVISLNNSIPWSMDDWHPKTSGRFSFIVANAVISQTSPAILLLPPVTLKEMIIRLIVIAFLCHWISDVCLWISGVCLLCMKYICRKLRKEKKEEKDNNNEDETLQSNAHQHHGPEIRDIMNGANNSHSICLLSEWRCQNQTCSTVNKDRILSLVSRTFTIADIILGFLKEISLLLICVDGQIIPVGFCCVPGIFLLCRVIYWIFFFVNRSRETNVRFSSVVEIPTIISNMIAIPAFCIATLVIIHIRYRPPCGMMDLSPVVLLAVCTLIFIFYLGIKPKVEAKRKPYTQRTEGQPESQQLVNVLNGVRGPPEINADLGRPETNGDIGQPEDNRKPNCQGPVPPGILGNPNVGEASMQSAVFNEGDPEDQVISKPKDGQPKVAEKVPNNSHVGAGQCLPTIELEVVVDKGPVSNG